MRNDHNSQDRSTFEGIRCEREIGPKLAIQPRQKISGPNIWAVSNFSLWHSKDRGLGRNPERGANS